MRIAMSGDKKRAGIHGARGRTDARRIAMKKKQLMTFEGRHRHQTREELLEAMAEMVEELEELELKVEAAYAWEERNEVQQEQLEKFADALEERGFFARRYAAGLIELFRAAKSLHHHCCHLDLRNQARALDMPIVEFVRAYAEVNPGLNKFSSHRQALWQHHSHRGES